MLVNELILDRWAVINGSAVNPNVGIRKVVLISTNFGVSFRE